MYNKVCSENTVLVVDSTVISGYSGCRSFFCFQQTELCDWQHWAFGSPPSTRVLSSEMARMPCTTCLVFVTNWISFRVALSHTLTHTQRLPLKWSSCNATRIEWPLQTACASWQFAVEESLQMTGRRKFPTTWAVYALSGGEIVVGDSALLEQLDGTCDVNRTAVTMCDCAQTGSC